MSDRDLPREFVAVDLAVADAIPRHRVRIGLIGAKPPCWSDRRFLAATHRHAPHPDRICDAIRPLPAEERGEIK
jgi:hypothetical protein